MDLQKGFIVKCKYFGEESPLCDEYYQIAIENGQSHRCDRKKLKQVCSLKK